MIIKLLGILDLLSLVAILFAFIMPHKILFYTAAYLLLKGGTFAYMGNLVSFIDVFCGCYTVLLMFGVSFTIITVLVLLYLAQKSLVSLA